jgi:hypothetical protein
MKRLVYSPSVKIWVRTDFGVINLSPYITECQVNRKIDDTSTFSVVFRNPKVVDENGKNRFMFTEHEANGQIGPVFHPMDPITVVMERIGGKPIQVFTGYCDTVPYVQLFPGTAKITASCTLKRLLYTFWDPGLPFVRDFLYSYGWNLGGDGVVRREDPPGHPINNEYDHLADQGKVPKRFKTNKLNDGGIGALLYATLNEVGGWDDKNIYIQGLPNNLSKIVSNIFDEFTADNKDVNEQVSQVLSDFINNGHFGSAMSTGGPSTGGGGSDGQPLGGGAALPNPPASFANAHPELKPGILQVLYAVLKQFPSLSISATTNGTHSKTSLHYQGRAVDLVADDKTMKDASNWIHSHLGKNLTEGIHNPNLSIKNQVDTAGGLSGARSFWGIDSNTNAYVWDEHANHIHLGV